MELTEAVVDSQPSMTLPWQETWVVPISDLQYGAEGCDIEKFKRHIDWAMKYDHTYFIGLGDIVDVASPSGRQKLQNAGLYDSVRDMLDDGAQEHLEVVKKILDGTQDRWLGVHEGHHFWEFEADGSTTDTRLAEFLRAPFLGTCAITQIKFKGAHRKSPPCQIWSHHGTGSGATMAAPMNKLEKMMSRFPTVDIFLLAHYTRKVGYPVDALVPVFGKYPRLKAKRRILACTGGFYKGYIVGSKRKGRAMGGYVEQGMMPPTNLGGVIIKIRPVHTKFEDRLDMNIEL